MPKPRMQKRTALDVVLGQPASGIPSTESENGASGSSMSPVPQAAAESPTAENGAPQHDDTAEDAGESGSDASVEAVGSELDAEPTAAAFGRMVASDDESEDDEAQSAQPAVVLLPAAAAAAAAPLPAPAPASNVAGPRTRRQSSSAPSPGQTDPRFEPVLGRNDDAALVPFSTRLNPELRRRLKLYSAVSGESTTSLTNRALDYMLELAERKVGLR